MEVKELLGADFGSLGPVDLPENVKIIADRKVQDSRNAVVGANETGYHLTGVQTQDVTLPQNTSISVKFVKAKSHQMGKGLELCTWDRNRSHFQTRHTLPASMGADVLDENGRAVPIIMRMLRESVSAVFFSAVMEQHARLFVNKTQREYRYAWGINFPKNWRHLMCI